MSAERMYDFAWMEFKNGSWGSLGPVDELHALYTKALQKKAQTPEYATNPDVHPWVMAMWPTQPNPMGTLWTPNTRLGWALASPPPQQKAVPPVKAPEIEGVPTLGQHQDRVIAIEAGIIKE